MEKNTEKKIVTTEMFLAKKKVIDEKPEPFYSATFGGYIEIENTHGDAFVESLNSSEDKAYLNSRIIYENCPQFRDSVLLEEYGIKDPYDLPRVMYGSKVVEFYQLGDAILSIYGYNSDVVEQTKKK